MALFPQLPTHLELQVVGLLSPNEIACTVRALSKACAATYRSYTEVRLSQPVPQHAFARQWGVGSPALRFLTLEKRLELLSLTASSGVLENLQLAVDSAGCLLEDMPRERMALIRAAAAAGHMHICLWLRDRGLRIGADALNAAARAGRRDVCEQLLGLGCVPSIEAALKAAEGGHVGLMDWLLVQLPHPADREDLTSWPIWAAAYGCDLATLQRLLTVWLPAVLQGGGAGGAAEEPRELLDVAQQRYCVEAATRSPTPDWRNKVEWLEGLFPDLPRHECGEVAALPDAVERLSWLRGRGYPLGEGSVYRAARTGNIAALTYLLDEAGARAVFIKPTPTEQAASGGHLAALQLLVARGCTVDASSTISHAAGGGHLAVVAWLVEELGVEVSELWPVVAWSAAQSGSLELLVWLRERGCPLTDGTFACAAECGCEAALEWLAEHGCPLGEGADCYDDAAQHGDLATVRCLRRLGVRWGPADVISPDAVLEAPFAMLRWLAETVGLPADWEAGLENMGDSVGEDNDAVRDWLREGKRRQEGAVPPHT